MRTIDITVNMKYGIEETLKVPCNQSSGFMHFSVKDAVEAVMQKFPGWSSMVVVFTNPKE